MARARKHLVCLSETPYYHVTSRCVRRAFLCGVDHVSGKSFEHRRSWLEDRIRVLASLFSVQLCAYAVMSNHYHLVVKLNPKETRAWTDADVLHRWTALFKGPLLVQRFLACDVLSKAEGDAVEATVAVYRERLGSLSWFMKCLNEPIARRANSEDDCTGHFWEARFHSQPLCSERALLAAMAYVDLNPIRAGMAKTLGQSEYTSIRARISRKEEGSVLSKCVARMLKRGELNHFRTPPRPIMQFSCAEAVHLRDIASNLPLRQTEYVKLLSETARATVHGKRRRFDSAAKSILARLGLSTDEWVQCASAFKSHFRSGDLRLKRSA